MAYPTDATIIAVVYALITVIVPELADFTEVLRSSRFTVRTEMGCRLCMSTHHAKHVFCLVSNEMVVFDFVMAESRGENRNMKNSVFRSIVYKLVFPRGSSGTSNEIGPRSKNNDPATQMGTEV